jgi:hypothetical protein
MGTARAGTVSAVRFALAVLLLAGCHFGAAEADAVGDDDSAAAPECATAMDCVLASSTCCGCGDFAMPDRGWQDSCEEVECGEPEPGACPAVMAACVDGACTTACTSVSCDLSCEGGFATDAAGCLVCACAAGADPVASCSADADCVAVPADCCGCARGGTDTAVLASDADGYQAGLDCDSDAACPEVDVCDPMAVPRCISGQCRLGEAGSPQDDAQACGRDDLPPCPEGTVCVLNADPDASSEGLGTCQ